MNKSKFSGKYRNRPIEINEDGDYIYSDTKKLVMNNLERDCVRCDEKRTEEGHDSCLGTLKGIMNACCGHGDNKKAYVQFLDGYCIRGEDAIIILDMLKRKNE